MQGEIPLWLAFQCLYVARGSGTYCKLNVTSRVLFRSFWTPRHMNTYLTFKNGYCAHNLETHVRVVAFEDAMRDPVIMISPSGPRRRNVLGAGG